MIQFCLEVLNDGSSLEDVNRTNMVLIPKVEELKNMSQYRPISLCTVIYKIISRILVNRLRMILELCIDETQSAFVPRRQITDNILIVYEVLHSLKKKEEQRQDHFL